MKKLFNIFFEKIPADELCKQRNLRWKMFLPKAKDHLDLKLIKVVLLLFVMLLLLLPISIVLAVFCKNFC